MKATTTIFFTGPINTAMALASKVGQATGENHKISVKGRDTADSPGEVVLTQEFPIEEVPRAEDVIPAIAGFGDQHLVSINYTCSAIINERHTLLSSWHKPAGMVLAEVKRQPA